MCGRGLREGGEGGGGGGGGGGEGVKSEEHASSWTDTPLVCQVIMVFDWMDSYKVYSYDYEYNADCFFLYILLYDIRFISI